LFEAETIILIINVVRKIAPPTIAITRLAVAYTLKKLPRTSSINDCRVAYLIGKSPTEKSAGITETIKERMKVDFATM